MRLRLLSSPLAKGSVWSLIAVVFKASAGLLINKTFSVNFGTAGLTLLSHFQNLTNLFTLLPAEGVNKAIMKYWSDPSIEPTQRKNLFNTALWVTVIIFAASFALLYIWYRKLFFDKFTQEYSSKEFLIVFLPAIFLMLITAYLNAIILARQKLKAFGLINVAGGTLLVFAVYTGVQFGSLDQALLSLTVGYALMLFCVVTYFFINKDMKASLSLGWPDMTSFKRISRFLIMAITVIGLGRLLDFVIRDYIIERYGLGETGLWQSVVQVSMSYTMLFTNAIGFVYYPRLCTMINEPDRLRIFVFRAIGFVAVSAILCLSLYYFNRTFFITLFFDKGFEAAAGLVRYQVLGDFFGMLSFLLTYILSAQVRTLAFVFSRVVSTIIYVSLIFLLIDKMEFESLTLAYMYRQISLFLILIFLNRKVLVKN